MRRVGALVAAVLAAAGCGGGGSGEAPDAVVVFAAASLAPALEDLAAALAASGGPAVRVHAASSATLARQIEAGAPADVFVSADPRWVAHLEAAGRVEPGSRVDVATNSLVLAAPAGRAFAGPSATGRPLAECFAGRLATGDPDHVPLGAYARGALERLGWWAGVAPRLVPAADARAALALVERGECAAGVLYASDAAGSDRVAVVEPLPADVHRPIVYPAVAVAGRRRPAVDAFLAALAGDAGRAALAARGLGVPR